MRDAGETSASCPRCQRPLPVTPTRRGAQLALNRLVCPDCGAALVRDIEGHADRGWRLDVTRRKPPS
jgi:hypothetical protein